MTNLLSAVLALAFAVTLSTTASAHEYTSGTIKVFHPWARATAPGATTGAGYMKIINQGGRPLRLLGASTPAAATVEIHTMSIDGGVMRMRPLTGGLVVPAGGEVALKAGGMHLMLIGLKKPLVEEDMVPLTLTFDGGITMQIDLYIEGMDMGAGDHEHH